MTQKIINSFIAVFVASKTENYDLFSKIAYVGLIVFIWFFALYHITYFAAVGRNQNENTDSLKMIWDLNDMRRSYVRMQNLQINRLSRSRIYPNLFNIFNLHLFHGTVGLYLLMLLWIMLHKNSVSDKTIQNLYCEDEIEADRMQAFIRRENQRIIKRKESKYLAI